MTKHLWSSLAIYAIYVTVVGVILLVLNAAHPAIMLGLVLGAIIGYWHGWRDSNEALLKRWYGR